MTRLAIVLLLLLAACRDSLVEPPHSYRHCNEFALYYRKEDPDYLVRQYELLKGQIANLEQCRKGFLDGRGGNTETCNAACTDAGWVMSPELRAQGCDCEVEP